RVVEEADRGDIPHLDAGKPHGRARLQTVDRMKGGRIAILPAEEALVPREDENEGHEHQQSHGHEESDADQEPPFPLHHDASAPTIPSTKLRTSGMVDSRISSGVPTARIRCL